MTARKLKKRRGVATVTLPPPSPHERERMESQLYRERAQQTWRAVTYVASDGCEVTVHPDGSEWFNAADWY